MWKVLIGLLIAGVVLVGGGGAAVWFSPLKDQILERMNQEPPKLAVRMEYPELGDLVRTVSAPGEIQPRTVVNISAQVSAKLLALPFKEGDAVKVDDVVARLESRDLVASLEQARAGVRADEARLQGVKAQMINARLEYERLQQLVETGDATQRDLDAAEASYLQASSSVMATEQQIEISKQNIERAQQDLENTILTSPMDGTIIAINTEVGETVLGTAQNAGTVIMQIADMSEMIMAAQVDEIEIAKIKPGQSATVYINAYVDDEYTGRLTFIGRQRRPSASGGGFFDAEITLDMPESGLLFTGLSANTDIAVETFFDAVRVPSQSVVDRRVEDLPAEIKEDNPNVDTDKTFARVVYRVIDGKTVVTPVTVGPSDLTHTVILNGLTPEDRVVTGPYRVLVDLAHDKDVRDEKEVEAEAKAKADAENARKAGATGRGGETDTDDANDSGDSTVEESDTASTGTEG